MKLSESQEIPSLDRSSFPIVTSSALSLPLPASYYGVISRIIPKIIANLLIFAQILPMRAIK